MPRPLKFIKKYNATAITSKKNKKTVACKKKNNDTITKKKRSKPKFKLITHALRAIRRGQRESAVKRGLRKTPMRVLIAQDAMTFDPNTHLRESTIEAFQEVVEACVISVLAEAMERRAEAYKENGKQTNIQVLNRNVLGSFKAWCKHKGEEFYSEFKRLSAQKKIKQ